MVHIKKVSLLVCVLSTFLTPAKGLARERFWTDPLVEFVGCGVLACGAVLVVNSIASAYNNSFISYVERQGDVCSSRYTLMNTASYSKEVFFSDVSRAAGPRYIERFIDVLLRDCFAFDSAYAALQKRLSAYEGARYERASSVLAHYAGLHTYLNELSYLVKKNRSYLVLRDLCVNMIPPQYNAEEKYPTLHYVGKLHRVLERIRLAYVTFLHDFEVTQDDFNLRQHADELIFRLESEKNQLIASFAYQNEKQMKANAEAAERLRYEIQRGVRAMEKTAEAASRRNEERRREERERERSEFEASVVFSY